MENQRVATTPKTNKFLCLKKGSLTASANSMRRTPRTSPNSPTAAATDDRKGVRQKESRDFRADAKRRGAFYQDRVGFENSRDGGVADADGMRDRKKLARGRRAQLNTMRYNNRL